MMCAISFGEGAVEVILNVPVYDPGLPVPKILMLSPSRNELLLYEYCAALEPQPGALPRICLGLKDVWSAVLANIAPCCAVPL